jgi:hypothetical protein
LRSIRSSSRAQRNERGFALIAALALAILYFGLVELLMIDASRELMEARQFRARVVALTLAENGAELAARNMTDPSVTDAQVSLANEDGEMSGTLRKDAAGQFEIEGSGTATGIESATESVILRGRVSGGEIQIQYAIHRGRAAE